MFTCMVYTKASSTTKQLAFGIRLSKQVG